MEKENNLTELLDAFSNGLGTAIDPISTTPFSDRLLAIKTRIERYGALEQAVREEFWADDGNRFLGYGVVLGNLALATW